jgi:hypothetical protein
MNVKMIRREMKKEKKKFSWTNKKLKFMCAYKKRPGDKAIPTTKDLLLERYNETKGRASPQVSLHESDVKDEGGSDADESIGSQSLDEFEESDNEMEVDEVESESEEEDAAGGMQFGSDSDDDNEEDDDEEEEQSDNDE